jgi:glycosyltransferase involved in cell wall biosynthesis
MGKKLDADLNRPSSTRGQQPHLAILFGSFRAGGIGRSVIRLTTGLLERGCRVDLVVGRRQGQLLAAAPPAATIVELTQSSKLRSYGLALAADPGGWRPLLETVAPWRGATGKLRYVPSFIDYLRTARPHAVLARTAPFGLVAGWARVSSGIPFRLVTSEHGSLDSDKPGSGGWNHGCSYGLRGRAYALADAVVAVSRGVADEMVARTGVARESIEVIHNPVVDDGFEFRTAEPVSHPWFASGEPPVILGVGTLKPVKDFPTLVRAFARVRERRPARLVILGDVRGETKDADHVAELKALPGQLGVAADVDFPGFASNPMAYMARAACFVLASRSEGLGNVLIEALASGCPVVSTDCWGGPREILSDGAYGPLVPVGDDAAMAEAIAAVLDSPPPRELLIARGNEFSVGRAVDRYLELALARNELDRAA